MPTMSNMNKPELYELCKQLQDVIIKLQFDMNCMEEENKLVNQNSENLLKEMVEIDKENEKLKEKLEDKTNRLTKLAEILYEKYRDN